MLEDFCKAHNSHNLENTCHTFVNMFKAFVGSEEEEITQGEEKVEAEFKKSINVLLDFSQWLINDTEEEEIEFNISQKISKSQTSTFTALATSNPQNPSKKKEITDKTYVSIGKVAQTKNIKYDLVEDMKKTRAKIYLFELSKLTKQKNKLLNDLGFNISDNQSTSTGNTQNIASKKISIANSALIGDKSISHTPPFTLIFKSVI